MGTATDSFSQQSEVLLKKKLISWVFQPRSIFIIHLPPYISAVI